MHQAGIRRDTERTEHAGTDEEFLRSLSLELRVERAGDEEICRVEELTPRTSQMNAPGVRYSDQALRALIADEEHEVPVASLTDRFGPLGAIGVILLERRPDSRHIKLLATCCRVVSSGVGSALLRWPPTGRRGRASRRRPGFLIRPRGPVRGLAEARETVGDVHHAVALVAPEPSHASEGPGAPVCSTPRASWWSGRRPDGRTGARATAHAVARVTP